MRPTMIVAGGLIALGIMTFAYQTTRGESLDASPAFEYQGHTYTNRGGTLDSHGPIEKSRGVPLPPVLGSIALAGGVGLLLVERTRARPVTHGRGLPHR